MDRRVILVEPSLRREEGGHYYQNIRAIQRELQTKGIGTVIVGCMESDASCQQLPTFQPAFSYLPTRSTGAIAKLASLVSSSWRFYRDVSTIFRGKHRIQLKPYDVLFMNTVLDTQIIGWGGFLWRHSSVFRKLGLKFVFLLKFRPTRRSRLYTTWIKTASWVAFRRLMDSLRNQVVLCTETELLQKEYQSLLNLPVTVLPLPIVSDEIEEVSATVRPPLTITYLGGDVYYKGFDLLVGALTQLEPAKLKQCRFKLQIKATNSEASVRHRLIIIAAERLQRLMQTLDGIEMVPGDLPTIPYLNLLRETDIFVLPYRSLHYTASTSGVFAEALTFGKIPIVPAGTWMGSELARFKLDGLTFRRDKAGDLAGVLGRVIENHMYYKEKIAHVKGIWQSCHNPRRFVDVLLARIGWESPQVCCQGNWAVDIA